MNICILIGCNSDEKKISLDSFNQIYKNINKYKYNISILYIENNNFEWINNLLNNRPDLVIISLHGGIGEDGTLQGLLECMKIPYLGSKVMSSSICMNKAMTKNLFRLNKIPTPEYILLRKEIDYKEYERKLQDFKYPLVIKPNRGGSSIGISIVHNKIELEESISELFKTNNDILIEKYIDGKEITCCITEINSNIESNILLDVNYNNKFYDYNSKYIDKDTKISLSKIPNFLQMMIKEMGKKAFRLLDCKGYATVDFILKEEQIMALEVNTLPGLTSRSLMTKAILNEYKSIEIFLDNLIFDELQSFDLKN